MAAENSDDDFDLFKKEMESQGVRKASRPLNRISEEQLKPTTRKTPNNSGSRHTAVHTEFQDLSSIPAPEIDQTLPGEPVLFVRRGMDKNRIRAFKRGQIPLDEVIDLHGLREQEARRALAGFFAESRRYRWQCIQIIHGKGRNSEQPGGVLKPLTIYWLKLQFEVVAFCSASEREGGAGATNVLLATNLPNETLD